MTFCLLGATGDVCAFLPVLWQVAQGGARPRLVVSKRYAGVLAGVSSVEPVIFDGEVADLDRAMQEARLADPQAVCVQTTGPAEACQKWAYGGAGVHSDSFVKEMWRLAGHLPLWREDPPLVIDQRDLAREAKLRDQFPQPAGRKRFRCLVHLDGNTSPFPYAPLLGKLIELAMPRWEVIDLGIVQSERIYDLLGLYQTADLLIACDSAPLHLARACPGLPVMALTKDTPSLWHGSPWRPQYVRYCRYGDFPARAADLIEQLFPSLCEFGAWRQPRWRVVHVWSEADGFDQAARKSWTAEFIDCPIEIGAAGRDSGTALKDRSRYPFLLDVLRLACMKAKDDDVLCLSRGGTLCPAGLALALKAQPLGYGPDLFCFPKKWWREHQTECPDLVLGPDAEWTAVLGALLKKHGGQNLPT